MKTERKLPTCQFCRVPSPIIVHAFCEEGHCEKRECIEKCKSCQDWFVAIDLGQSRRDANPSTTLPEEKPKDKWTVYLTAQEMAEMKTLAAKRQGSKDDVGVSTERFFSDRTEEDTIGLYGELAFERVTGLPMDRSITYHGDNGVDFRIGFTVIDVKTARKPYYLLVKKDEISKTLANVFVLAHFKPPNVITFLGWETKKEMEDTPVKEFGYRITNHHKHASMIRPMDSLSWE